MLSTAPRTLIVDGASVRTVEVITGDLLGWHPGAVRTGYFVEITLPAPDATRVAHELRCRGFLAD